MRQVLFRSSTALSGAIFGVRQSSVAIPSFFSICFCADLIEIMPCNQHWLRLMLNSTINCHLVGHYQWRYQNELYFVWKEFEAAQSLQYRLLQSSFAQIIARVFAVGLLGGTHLPGTISTSMTKSRLIFRQRPISRLMLLWLVHTSGALYMLDIGWILPVPDL
jgi:hypothetical protein